MQSVPRRSWIQTLPPFTKTLGVLLAVALLGLICYWAFLGYTLDRSIKLHTAECEAHLEYPAVQQCAIVFIPIMR